MIAERGILSKPIELHWAGWRSDTFRLQQAGWSISAEQNYLQNTMQIAFKNEGAGMEGISAQIPWDFIRIGERQHEQMPRVPVRLVGRELTMIVSEAPTMWVPVDAYPQMAERRRTSLEDFAHFAPAHARTQQIIVPEPSVDDLMERILEMQQGPRIERIKAEIAEGQRIEFAPRQKFHAQIISLAA